MASEQKENIWYIAVGIEVLLLMVSEYFGASALAFAPILLVIVFIGLWAFDVK